MSKSIMIKNLEFYWAKLGKPVSPFGTEQWEMQVRTTDASTKAELEAAGISIKELTLDDGSVVFTGSVKRKTEDRKGNRMDPPRVVDGSRQPVDGDKIGNGSFGNIILFSYDYEIKGRSGTAAMLTAVQVTKLVKYEGGGGIDFDFEDTVEDSSAAAEKQDLDFG